MSLKIRLRQQGRTNRQTYRLVVTDIRSPRDGKYIEMVGWYNPFSATANCQFNDERIQYWVDLGAQITPNAQALIARASPELSKQLREKEQARRLKKVQQRKKTKKQVNAK